MSYDSPIEELLAIALHRKKQTDAGEEVRFREIFSMDVGVAANQARIDISRLRDPLSAFIYPHVSVQNYVADFMLFFLDRHDRIQAIAIECDGYEFHERTKQQVERDKKRDRHFAKHCIAMLRFAGSEIFNDPDACVCEIYDVLVGRMHQLDVQMHAEWARPVAADNDDVCDDTIPNAAVDTLDDDVVEEMLCVADEPICDRYGQPIDVSFFHEDHAEVPHARTLAQWAAPLIYRKWTIEPEEQTPLALSVNNPQSHS